MIPLRYSKKNTIHYSWFLLLLNPVLSLIANIISIIRGKAPSYLVIAISIVIILSYLPILWDVRSNFYRIFYFPEEGLNFYTSIISFLSRDMGIQFIAVIVLYSILIVGIYVTLLKNSIIEIQKQKSSLYLLIVLLLFSFLFEYRQLFDLQKTTLSIALFITAMEAKNIIFKSILFSLSIMFHPLMILLPILGLVSSIFTFNNRLHIYIFLTSFVLGFVMTEFIISLITNYLMFSEKIVDYILINKSKFSSENIALMIKLLRILSIVTIFIVFLHYLKTTSDHKLKKYSNLILLLSSVAILLSFNEIALERFYLGLITLVIFVSIKFQISLKHLLIISIFIGVNIFLHGFYTLNIVFLDSYDVFIHSAPKLDTALKVFYYPTLFLLDFEYFGQSNEYINRYTQL